MKKECFLLNHTWSDTPRGVLITLQLVTQDGQGLKVTIDSFYPSFFIPHFLPPSVTTAGVERKALPLKALDGTGVDVLYFSSVKTLRSCAQQLRGQGYRVYESDVPVVERFLMERQVKGFCSVEGEMRPIKGGLAVHNPRIRGQSGSVALRVLSFDIETNAASGELYSIGCSGTGDKVFMRGAGSARDWLEFCPDERELLNRFFAFVQSHEPDVLIGWNVIDFDLTVLQRRCEQLGVGLILGRGGERGRLITTQDSQRCLVRIPGRVVIDLPMTLRANNYGFEEYSLDFVASHLLGKHKLIEQSGQEKIAQINALFERDKEALARYNLEDARLTLEIFNQTNLLPNAVERSRLSGHLLDRAGGSVAAFDYLYLPLLHRAGYVANDVADVLTTDEPLPGGYVLEPLPGVYQNVVVLDFKSLYPSIIMSFKIDPLGLASTTPPRVQGPEGPAFSCTDSILPAIIQELMQARAEAKKNDNPHLSYAIKILMNSFYGVLGTPNCRFFSAALARTITRTGQYLLRSTCSYIEEHCGYKVIYGDTDSLFVLLGEGAELDAHKIGSEIVPRVNHWLEESLRQHFGVQSHLELEYETHFRQFLIPTLRGGEGGSKKHYCGLVEQDGQSQLVFKGMESARSDWTDLAKQFQHELCMRIFTHQPVKDYIVSVVNALKAGACDKELVYRKRMRKNVADYTTHVPPHVQAAKLLDRPVHTVRYLITLQGPQPIEKLSAPLDYDHYVQCQLKPIADTLLVQEGIDFDRIVSGQMDLFG
jgi:DNA polymerase-2